MNYIEEQNPWSILLLEDGTKLRYRWIATSVESQGVGPDGVPQYKVGWIQVFNIEPEPKIKIENLSKEIKD